MHIQTKISNATLSKIIAMQLRIKYAQKSTKLRSDLILVTTIKIKLSS